MAASTLEFLPLHEDEYELFDELVGVSFAGDIMDLIYPNGHTDADTAHSVARMKRGDAKYPGRFFRFKVIDNSLPDDDPIKKIVGISQWLIYPEFRSGEQLAEEKAWHEADHEEHGDPPSMDSKMMGEFMSQNGKMREKHLGGQPFVYLNILGTRPSHWRKGVGALSMKWGCDQADKLGLPAYLESSPKGKGLYEKWGFQGLEVMPFDFKAYGLDHELPHWIMLRPAPAKKQE